MKYVFSTQFHGSFCHILELVAMYKLISYISLTVRFQVDLHAYVFTNAYEIVLLK